MAKPNFVALQCPAPSLSSCVDEQKHERLHCGTSSTLGFDLAEILATTCGQALPIPISKLRLIGRVEHESLDKATGVASRTVLIRIVGRKQDAIDADSIDRPL